MKIGLVGESPHDTNSVRNLLERMYPQLNFKNLISNIHGSMLDHQVTKSILRKEYQFEKPDLVIFIRDLDSTRIDLSQYRKRMSYFADFRTVVNSKAIFLLFIWEIEALVFCDISTFGHMYECECIEYADPHLIISPKEELKLLSKRYTETHNPKIFARLNPDKILEKSKNFREFQRKLNKAILQ